MIKHYLKKQFLLIPVRIVLMIIGSYIVSYSVTDFDKTLSPTERYNRLISTDYPIGVGLFALGVTFIGVVIMWKYISSKKKSRDRK